MIQKNIKNMSPYLPPLEGRGENSDTLLLDFNERVDPVPARIKQALIDYISKDKLQLYPAYGDIVEKIANYAKVDSEELMITNGSDQGLDLIIRSICKAGDQIIIPVPTFAIYKQSASIENLEIIEPAYTDELEYPLEAVIELITEQTKIIVICNPNNPTGTPVSVEDILFLAKSAPNTAILVDECYFEFSKITVKDHLKEYPNLFITRTFSKTWGLASLRIGYIMSNSENIQNLLKVRGPYDVNTLSVVALNAALDEPSYVAEYVDEVMNKSLPMLTDFLDNKGIKYYPTKANYILTRPENPEKLVKGLARAGILVRPRSGAKIDDTVRISIGRVEHTERLIKAWEKLI